MGLGFKLKRRKIYVMYKNLKTPVVECLENGNYHKKCVHPKTKFFYKRIPENCKNQKRNRIKSKQINRTVNLCALPTNDLI